MIYSEPPSAAHFICRRRGGNCCVLLPCCRAATYITSGFIKWLLRGRREGNNSVQCQYMYGAAGCVYARSCQPAPAILETSHHYFFVSSSAAASANCCSVGGEASVVWFFGCRALTRAAHNIRCGTISLLLLLQCCLWPSLWHSLSLL